MPDLERLALESLKEHIRWLETPKEMLESLEAIRNETCAEGPVHVAELLEHHHRSALLKYKPYRAMVEKDKKMIWSHLDAFNFTDDMAKMSLAKCSSCGRSCWSWQDTEPISRDVRCFRSKNSFCNFSKRIACWVSRHEAAVFNGDI